MKSGCRNYFLLLCALVFFSSVVFVGCATAPPAPPPDQLKAPKARMDNNGAYMCPFTRDGVVAEWVDKAINAKMGAAVGEEAGALAGQQLGEDASFIGSALGSALGEKAGRKVALEAIGGMEAIKKSSDLSFDTVQDLAVYVYVKHSTHEQYQDVLDAAMVIYPELEETYAQSLANAPKK